MKEPSEDPDIKAQRAELERTLERVRLKKMLNDALENSLISRQHEKHHLQAIFLILEEHLETLHEKCAAQFAGTVSPEVAAVLTKSIQQTVAEALNGLREEFIRMLQD